MDLLGVSISEAARRLGRTPERVRGSVEALRIEVDRIGNALVMSEDDFERLRLCLMPEQAGTAPARDRSAIS